VNASAHARIAAARFGLGPREGDLARVGRDPRGWAEEQVGRAEPLPGVPPAAERVVPWLAARRGGPDSVERAVREAGPRALRADVRARTEVGVRTRVPFAERWARFWSNHFAVSAARPAVMAFAGPYEQEAIRPNAFGRFADLLLAATRHPAMLVYLDQAQSVGPDSPAGRRRGLGLNENLAREVLELHTLGVDGGYGQDDVRALAEILTGWTLARPGEPGEGGFRFAPAIHQPGAKRLLGRTYREAGEEEGIAALGDLARHPSTARHVAAKLVRHFVADAPPADAVERVARVFRDADGDLSEVARAVVRLDAAWADPAAKVRTPDDLVTAALRLVGADGAEPEVLRSYTLLGQVPWSAPSPAGWPDTAEAWAGPEAVVRRIDWALAVARRLGRRADPPALLRAAVGDGAGPETHFVVANAPSVEDGLALVLASPEFQRR
jgi:uncharacterized protein (DUF1800 family)